MWLAELDARARPGGPFAGGCRVALAGRVPEGPIGAFPRAQGPGPVSVCAARPSAPEPRWQTRAPAWPPSRPLPGAGGTGAAGFGACHGWFGSCSKPLRAHPKLPVHFSA